MTLSVGQSVRVYPHGIPAQTALGTVQLISGNQRSIAVAFEHLPPFAHTPQMPVIGIHPELGAVMLAGRQVIDGKAWGPWIELGSGGHYEIEAVEEMRDGKPAQFDP